MDKNKERRIENSLLIIAGALILVCFFMGGMRYADTINMRYLGTEVDSSKPELSDYQNDSCSNLSLEESANCFVETVKTSFIYIQTKDSVTDNRKTSDIITNGGDCYDWSLVYSRFATYNNIYSKIVFMDTGDRTAHAVVIISNEDTYCLLDQTIKPRCYNFK